MLPDNVRDRLNGCVERTAKNDAMTLVLALSYSSKWELTEAVRNIASKVKDGGMELADITDKTIDNALATSFMPDPDLLIRTGGEMRISNFLLWQIAYSEIYVTDKYWPDFNKDNFRQAIIEYQSRERRYGKTSEQVK
jgi:undecaprenyl diphosphate synthase